MTRDGLGAIHEADVYVGDQCVARLSRAAGGSVRFDYLDEELRTTAVRADSVAWTLARSRRDDIRTAAGKVPAFFAGLLPEGVRLEVAATATGAPATDQMTVLMAVGADTIGDVRVVPTGIDPPPVSPMFDPVRDRDFTVVAARLTESLDADPVALPGVQPKVTATASSPTTPGTSALGILKLSNSRLPRLVENENFFMSMAASCGLPAATTAVVHDSRGRSALLVNRFDRDGPRRVAQEDACQVAGIDPESKYRIKTETALTVLAEACERGGGSRGNALLELLRLVAFSWLIGNGDLHGKNLSIHNPDGAWRPTPAYDLVCTQPYAGWRDPMALNMYGRANRLSRADFLAAAQRLGLAGSATAQMLDDLVDAARPWPDLCHTIGYNERTTELLTRMLTTRIASLK
ncbi:type II toxin-antitoxin system HipA family toxin [Mycolicibacterium sp. S3B2]|uniref:type II toxin-antitoxin system HipA family toxin n=1 Tax=Mycolicibacterium sp. S3B2 TaxID=3415120 RepID=UPI003C7D6924